MGFAHRLLYPALNATWGASLGTCAALLAYQVGAADPARRGDRRGLAEDGQAAGEQQPGRRPLPQ